MSQIANRHHAEDKSTLGLWVYLMTDCLLFASLFATFAVLRHSTFGGPAGSELFSLSFVLVETIILLTSSFTIGIATLVARHGKRRQVLFWTALTLVLGLFFLSMEFYEFSELVHEGHSWQENAFLSAFFTLVGAHGLHIVIGVIWIIVLLVQMISGDLSIGIKKRLAMLGIYWHFLDVIWIFIFTYVYLLGAVK